jgi:hypothetical protein
MSERRAETQIYTHSGGHRNFNRIVDSSPGLFRAFPNGGVAAGGVRGFDYSGGSMVRAGSPRLSDAL